jgi:hypothetical protein
MAPGLVKCPGAKTQPVGEGAVIVMAAPARR